MNSITVHGLHDPQLVGTFQDDPLPAEPGKPGFWNSVTGGWQSPEEVGKPLFVRLPSPTPVPQILFDARDVSGFEVLVFNEDVYEFTTLEGVPVDSAPPVLTALSSTSAHIGGPDVLLKVEGTGFSRGALIMFNGAEESTRLVGLETTINMASATTPGSYEVRVVNKNTGEVSEPLMFEIEEPVTRSRRSRSHESDEEK